MDASVVRSKVKQMLVSVDKQREVRIRLHTTTANEPLKISAIKLKDRRVYQDLAQNDKPLRIVQETRGQRWTSKHGVQ